MCWPKAAPHASHQPGRTVRRARRTERAMPLFMDVHHLGDGVTQDAVAKAHLADLQTQDRYDVR